MMSSNIADCYGYERLLYFIFEKKSLIEDNKMSLADRVEQVSDTRGDGYGFDILSFKADGNPKFIEVKTSAKQNEEFFITSNKIIWLTCVQQTPLKR